MEMDMDIYVCVTHCTIALYMCVSLQVLVKLTPDAAGAPPSAMRVVGAACPFAYDPAAGAAGCFKP